MSLTEVRFEPVISQLTLTILMYGSNFLLLQIKQILGYTEGLIPVQRQDADIMISVAGLCMYCSTCSQKDHCDI